MGLGKTFVGAEKLIELGAKVNLIVCQKSKIDDWIEHFRTYYNYKGYIFCNLTLASNMVSQFVDLAKTEKIIGFINYDLIFRRKELLKLNDFTLLLDESSLIQNEQAKRSKFILKMQPKNVILLSGTPTSGKYETLWSQLHLLGWNISKDLYWRQYVDVEYIDNEGFPIKVVKGYKNVERLKQKMRDYGCRFLKTDEVFDLPKQVFNEIKVNTTKEYRKFRKDRIVEIELIAKDDAPPIELKEDWQTSINIHSVIDEGNNIKTKFVGDTTLTKMLYERMLCGSYNPEKLQALKDLISSTEDRLIVFYNFNNELEIIKLICEELNKPISIVNGKVKNLDNYNNFDNSVTIIQYQAGSMGLNLQLANKIIYFTPPLSTEQFEQSKKRTHRIGQDRTCFYYKLVCKNSIEERIYRTLDMRKDYTDELFREEEEK